MKTSFKVLSAILLSFLAFQPLGFSRIEISDGRKVVTTAGTRVQLTPGTTATTAYHKIDICAEEDNTDTVTVGGSTVVSALSTRRGIPLAANDCYTIETKRGEAGDASNIWLDSDVSGEGVTFTIQFEER